MVTGYERLRGAIANLAASADDQAEYLDKIHRPLTAGGSAASYPNDELALEFEDAFLPANGLVEAGELTVFQRDAASRLDALLEQWSGRSHHDFWKREALWSDPRWDVVRSAAKDALDAFTR